MFSIASRFSAEHPWLMAFYVFVLGAIVGSFLNVCIYRIAEGTSIIKPRSRCRSCGKPIAWYDNIPLISWFLLRGKCRQCGAPIAFRYVFIEFLTAILFVLCWLSLDGEMVLIGFAFIGIMICVAFIDFDHLIIPDSLSIGGMFLGLIFSFAFPVLHDQANPDPYLINGLRSMLTALFGVLFGSAILLWVAIVAEAILDKDAMGFGDIKLLGCIGAFCGWQGAVFAIFAGALLGAIFTLPVLISQKMGLSNPKQLIEKETLAPWTKVPFASPEELEELKASASGKSISKSTPDIRIPFGPWLACAAVLYFILLRGDVNTYLNFVKDLIFLPIFS